MALTFRPPLVWIALWAAVVGVGLAVRPPLPVDETRYLAVAWDMWLEGQYLVPHLNGEPYSHKPPLLFWLMTAGWHVFGVNDWWPRLVAPLFGLGSLFLTARLAHILWPDRPDIPETAPLLVLGSLFWAVFTTLTMFDMMLAFFTLAALIALVMAGRTGRWRGFVAAGIAIGLGVLAKGPAVLLHFLPVALSAPLWLPYLSGRDGTQIRSWRRWFSGVAAALGIAVMIGLAWAVPAATAGGEAYRDAIFWGQSAGRIVKSFAHGRPFWWYAAVIPVLVLPWLLWPPLWRGFRRLGGTMPDGGVRLCLIWIGTAFLVFSAVSGKQLHYLLPEFPALALLAGYVLAGDPETRPYDAWLPGGFLVIAGLLMFAAPFLPIPGRAGEMAAEIHAGWGSVIIAAGIFAGIARVPLLGICVAAVGTVIAIYLAFSPILAAQYDLAPIAKQIRAYEAAGKRTANFGKYHGQYHFLGRLRLPVPEIGQRADDEAAFLAAHPDGYVVAYYRNVPDKAQPLFTFPFRKLTAVIWPAQTLIDHPGLGDRQ